MQEYDRHNHIVGAETADSLEELFANMTGENLKTGHHFRVGHLPLVGSKHEIDGLLFKVSKVMPRGRIQLKLVGGE